MSIGIATQPALEVFPDIYRNLLPAAFRRPVPQEVLATCDNCAMCAPAGAGRSPEGATYFNAATKCCTYHPKLPNYLVGAILADTSPEMAEGRERVQKAIRNGADCWPVGLAIPAVYQWIYEKRGEGVFGGAQSMRCPYFQEGPFNCTIWKYRNSVCSTWFCKHVRGEDGRNFWMAAKSYVEMMEHVLSRHALLAHGLMPHRLPSPVLVESFSRYDVDGLADPAAYASAWGHWKGREEDFFVACFHAVRSLDRDDFARIAGTLPELVHLPPLEEALDRLLAPTLPERLLRNPRLAVFPQPDGTRLVSTSAGSFSVSEQLVELLGVFDGHRTTADANAVLQERHGLVMGDALLTKLYHNRVLVPSNP